VIARRFSMDNAIEISFAMYEAICKPEQQRSDGKPGGEIGEWHAVAAQAGRCEPLPVMFQVRCDRLNLQVEQHCQRCPDQEEAQR